MHRALCLMIRCVGVLTVQERSVLVSGANLLTAGILLVSPGQWAAGALGYRAPKYDQGDVNMVAVIPLLWPSLPRDQSS